MEDQVFRDPSVKDGDCFRVILDGKVLPHSWNSAGAALAGLAFERQRAAKRGENQ